MKDIIVLQSTNYNREISVLMHIQQIWILLLENLSIKSSDNQSTIISRTRLQLMMQYIHNHYSENISLENIANSVAISKSSALHLFQDNIKLTPVNYLINFRLKQGALLLAGTEKKIATISVNVGFNSVDHTAKSPTQSFFKTAIIS